MSTPSQPARASPLLSWLVERGASIGPLTWPVSLPGGGRGVCLGAAVARGAALLSVPASAALTADGARATLAPLPRLAALAGDDDELCLALLLCAAVGAAVAPATAPAELAALAPYMRALPPASELCDALSCWSPQQLSAACLPPTVLAEVRSRQAALRRDWSAAAASLEEDSTAAAAAAANSAATALCSCLRRGMTWRNMQWARLCVASRSVFSGFDADTDFAFGGLQDMLPLAMIPLGDMVNHVAPCVSRELVERVEGRRGDGGGGSDSTAPPLLADADWLPAAPGGGGGGGSYALRASTSASAGCEVCISYGDRCGSDLLETYGFVLPWPRNAHEVLSVETRALVRAAGLGEGDGDADPAEGQDAADAAAWRRALADEAAAALASRAAPSGTDEAAALCAAQRSVWAEACAPATLELPCAAEPGVDALSLLRLLALDVADARSLRGAGVGASFNLHLSRLERPVSRANELRVLACLRALVMAALATMLGCGKGLRAAAAALRLPPAEAIAAARGALSAERGSVPRAAAGAASPSGGLSGGTTPWPDDDFGGGAGGDDLLPLEPAAAATAAAFPPSPSLATAARRAALASDYRMGQLAVGILQLRYIADMLAVSEGRPPSSDALPHKELNRRVM